jgi:hypothetical protein
MLCTIRVQLDVRFEDLPRYISSGNVSFRMVKVDMVMSPNGNTLDFDVYFQDQRLEKVSSRFKSAQTSLINTCVVLGDSLARSGIHYQNDHFG